MADGQRTPSRRDVMKTGLATAGFGLAAGTARGQESGEQRPDFGEWLEDVDGGFRDARGQDEVTVQVGADGNGGPFAFSPANLWIDPGTTVVFQWASDNHNVVVEGQPADAGWEGHDPIEDTGFSFESTFETEGMYRYFCEPHRSLGMLAGLAVGDEVPTRQIEAPGGEAGADGGDGGTTVLPLGSVEATLVFILYGFAGLAMVAVLGAEGLSELRQRGGLRGPKPDPAEAATDPTEPSRVQELDHHEYDPKGTASLIVLYLAILVGMWLFMYFVEFLGNGPTVIG